LELLSYRAVGLGDALGPSRVTAVQSVTTGIFT
jgi:hypothetical protein